MMTQALELTGGEKVLKIGTGSGYQAAVLSKLTREVYSIELVEALAERSSAQLAQDGYANVKFARATATRAGPSRRRSIASS